MKKLEELERLDMLDLERIAQDESIRVPATLKHDIAITARALEMATREEEQTESAKHRPLRRRIAMFSYPAAAVAVIAVGLALTFRDIPKDTFDDPQLAYTQMEQVFGFISEKMNTGIAIADAAEPAFEKTINALQ